MSEESKRKDISDLLNASGHALCEAWDRGYEKGYEIGFREGRWQQAKEVGKILADVRDCLEHINGGCL